MAADLLATQGNMTSSATMVLAYLSWNIPVAAPEGVNFIGFWLSMCTQVHFCAWVTTPLLVDFVDLSLCLSAVCQCISDFVADLDEMQWYPARQVEISTVPSGVPCLLILIDDDRVCCFGICAATYDFLLNSCAVSLVNAFAFRMTIALK